MSLFIKATLNYSRLIKKFFLILNLNSYGKSPEKYGFVLGVTMGRVLVLIQVRRAPPVADKHTSQHKQPNKHGNEKRGGRGVRAEPLGVRPAHTVALIFVFIPSFMACPSPLYLPLSLSSRYTKRRLFLTNFRATKNLRDTRCALRPHCFPHIRLM